jgi:G2/mitotic-specific cyclin 2
MLADKSKTRAPRTNRTFGDDLTNRAQLPSSKRQGKDLPVPRDQARDHRPALNRTVPREVEPFAGEIFAHISSLQEEFVPGERFMSWQRELTTEMRAMLVDWMVDVHAKFRLGPESLFLAVNVLDRYLGLRQVTRKRFQLCGACALLIAAKFE